MLPKDLTDLLEKREFISVATCDFKGRPNAAPKFVLKVEGNTIYLVDYTIGMTWKNLKANPRISMSLTDTRTLKGYQLNGSVKIMSRGKVFDKLRQEMTAKEIRLTTQHIIDEVRGQPAHETFEILISEKFVIFAVKIEEVIEIDIHGELKRNKK
ncbi:MAG: pyridoxamine 5'-phosphate oxidase family protein [Candidatus Omnitrophica bacterium]|nr:pyridoxamine 5'-phosphate oxidase family protein [Candidatus Omnitrophota bacterium]